MSNAVETFRKTFMELARQSRLEPEEASVKLLAYYQQNPMLSSELQVLYMECVKEVQQGVAA